MRTLSAIAISAVLAPIGPSVGQVLSPTSPFIGHWTASRSLACDRTNDSLIIIERDGYNPHESSCVFDSLNATDDRMDAELACVTEGDETETTVAARLLDADTALIGDEIANLQTMGVDYYRCIPDTAAAPVTAAGSPYPEVVQDARLAVRESYNAFQVVEYCENAGFDNYGYTNDAEFQQAIKRIESLTGDAPDVLERTWSEVRGMVMSNIERQPSSRMAGTCSLAPDRVSRIIAIADALESYQPEPARDVMPSTSRPF